MSLEREFCIQKLDAVLVLIKRLLDSEFPHTDTKDALEQLALVYKAERGNLLSLSPRAAHDTVLGYCLDANVRIAQLKYFLGMLVRSANLRNAFELFFPIKVLARELLTPVHANLILSSEWNFSPFTFPISPDELPQFIFIGVPASESHNALILPLAGHELGHVVWRRKRLKERFESRIRDSVLHLYRDNWTDVCALFFGRQIDVAKLETDLFIRGIWGKSVDWTRRQVEELFCDFLGIFVFGQAYLHAFRYLVAPSLGRQRAVYYPSLKTRAMCMQYAANHYGIPGITNFPNSFQEQDPKLTKPDRLILQMADKATDALYSELLPLVENHVGDAWHFQEGANDQQRAGTDLRSLIPANVDSIAAIVNAGWELRLAIADWDILEKVTDDEVRMNEKKRVLNELMLKSFEVYEYRKRIAKYAS